MRRPRASTVYYGLEFFLALPSYVLVAVYLIREMHFSPLQLVLMGTVMEAVVFASEIPTGAVADTYGRRRSLIISFLLQGTAWILVGAVSNVVMILAAWGLWGFGYTFMSGAYEAWITDEVGVANVGPVFLRGTRLYYVGSLVGLLGGVALATQSLRAAVICGGVAVVLAGLVCIVVMPERGFVRRPANERDRALAELRARAVGGARVVRAQPLLWILLAVTFFAGMSSEAFDRLWEAHLIRDVGLPGLGSLDPVVWFGIIGAATMVAGFVVTTLVIRRFEGATSLSLARSLLAISALLLAAQVVFGFALGLGLAIVTLLVVNVMRGLTYPLYMTWLNRQISDSSVRATVISMAGQADAVGQAGGGPALGTIGNVFGIRAALVAGGIVLAPALGLYARAFRHGGKEPEIAHVTLPV